MKKKECHVQSSELRDVWCEKVIEGKEYAYNAGALGSIPGQEDPLEKGMATHSSILAWQILWTEEPDGLQFMGSQSWTRLSN